MKIGNLLEVHYNKNKLNFVDYGAWESRNLSTMKLIEAAWNRYVRAPEIDFRKPKVIRINTGDVFNNHSFSTNSEFSYSINGPHDLRKCIPTFIFDGWPECGITDYEETRQEMTRRGQAPHEDDRVFWIGADTNQIRIDMCKVAQQYPDMLDLRMMSWNRTNPKSLYTNTPTYVSLPDHCRYRVLIDLGAAGYSGRLPLLLASGRPVIITERIEETWFYWDGTLKPWVHYIPCKPTVDSVMEAVRWTFEHKEEAAEIGKRAADYANTYLTRDVAIQRIGSMLYNALKTHYL